jgi:hypothetical protein
MALVDIGAFNFTNAVEATRAIPEAAVPIGTTVLQAAITRASLDPAIVLAWSLEVSRNGGASWLPWGAAGTVGGVAHNKDGSVATESTFTLFLAAAADAQTRVRGSLTNSGARMTTTITIRGDTTSLPQRAALPEHHSVLYDNFIEVRGNTVTTLTTASFAITSAANRAALLGLVLNRNDATSVTSICGGVTGAAVANTFGNGGSGSSVFHAVKAPASGSQTGSMSWVGAIGGSLGVMTASGVDQTTPVTNGVNSSGTSATPSVTVTTAVGDLTMACGYPANAFSSPTQISLWLDTTITGGGGSRGPGTGTSDVHSWTQTSGLWVCSGANLKWDGLGGGGVTDGWKVLLH